MKRKRKRRRAPSCRVRRPKLHNPEAGKFKIYCSAPEKLKALIIDRKMKEFQEEDLFEGESTHAFNARTKVTVRGGMKKKENEKIKGGPNVTKA